MGMVLSVFSAFGLSSAAGLNAYLPLLVVALLARFTDLVKLSPPWDVLTSWWVIGALVVLLIIETLVDKVPAADTANDVINTAIRPAAGAVLFAANSGNLGEVHPVLALICGLLIAGGVHAAKATARPVVTATTAGTGNWLVSTLEDVVLVHHVHRLYYCARPGGSLRGRTGRMGGLAAELAPLAPRRVPGRC